MNHAAQIAAIKISRPFGLEIKKNPIGKKIQQIFLDILIINGKITPYCEKNNKPRDEAL